MSESEKKVDIDIGKVFIWSDIQSGISDNHSGGVEHSSDEKWDECLDKTQVKMCATHPGRICRLKLGGSAKGILGTLQNAECLKSGCESAIQSDVLKISGFNGIASDFIPGLGDIDLLKAKPEICDTTGGAGDNVSVNPGVNVKAENECKCNVSNDKTLGKKPSLNCLNCKKDTGGDAKTIGSNVNDLKRKSSINEAAHNTENDTDDSSKIMKYSSMSNCLTECRKQEEAKRSSAEQNATNSSKPTEGTEVQSKG